MTSDTITAYMVQEVGWHYNDEFCTRDEDETATRHVYLDRGKAEVICREKEAEARKTERRWGLYWNLYMMGGWGLEDHTTLSESHVRQRLGEFGFQGIPEAEALFEWLNDRVRDGTSEEKAFVWGLMDRCRFFEVVPVEIELEE